jgi:hypothetical protein
MQSSDELVPYMSFDRFALDDSGPLDYSVSHLPAKCVWSLLLVLGQYSGPPSIVLHGSRGDLVMSYLRIELQSCVTVIYRTSACR